MSLIELEGVTKVFQDGRKKASAKLAVDSLDLFIEDGEFVSLLGPSGCGKTVTLSLIAGFEAPTLGTVSFKGSPIRKPGPDRGVVFQEYSLFPWLTVRENVVFATRNAMRAAGEQPDRAQLNRRAENALSTVGLADSLDARPNTLSGGMKQRVAIARLLAMDSEVFLMDEPFSALDEQTRSALDESIYQLWKHEGKTVVFVTHSISEAVLVSSRIVLMSDSPGRVIKEWRLPGSFVRDPSSPAFQALCGEIRALMPSSSCSFVFEGN